MHQRPGAERDLQHSGHQVNITNCYLLLLLLLVILVTVLWSWPQLSGNLHIWITSALKWLQVTKKFSFRSRSKMLEFAHDSSSACAGTLELMRWPGCFLPHPHVKHTAVTDPSCCVAALRPPSSAPTTQICPVKWSWRTKRRTRTTLRCWPPSPATSTTHLCFRLWVRGTSLTSFSQQKTAFKADLTWLDFDWSESAL